MPSGPQPTTRRRVALAAPLTIVALAAGAVAAYAAPGTITAAQAPAVAAAISIRHADLPKDEQKSNPITAEELQQDAALTRCVGGVPVSDALANTQSPNFQSVSGSTVVVNSGTEILPSTALVATDFAAITGNHGLPCLLRQLRSELVGTPPKDETVKSFASRLSPVVAGVAQAFAYRFKVVITQTKSTTTLILPIYVDVIGFAYGQAEVSLSVMVVGAKPSTALDRRLAALLVARARQAVG
ncbi:MAG: hypothetical protein ABR947_00370 [Solirubrobacteraceae bacterium]|jgi:hypothetical protein